MGSSVHTITIDADDPRKLAGFWEQVLDYERTYESSEGDDEVEIVISPKDGKGDDILFGEVHDEKKVKNRIHLDLKPTDQDAEVERVLALGATRDRHRPGRDDVGGTRRSRGERVLHP